MGSIPLPALDIHTQQPSPLAQYAQLQQIQGQQQAQRLREQQIMGAQQENQTRALQLQDQQAMTAAMKAWDGKDLNELPGLVLKQGGSAQAVFGLKQHILDQQTKVAALDKDTLANQQQKNDIIAGHLESVKSATDKPTAYQDAITDLVNKGLMKPGQAPPQYPGDDQLDMFEKQFMGQKQIVEQALKAKETQAQVDTAAARKQQAATGAAEFSAKLPGGVLNPVTLAGQEAQARQNVESSPQGISLAATKAAVEAQARQSAAQGSPEDAGKLLAAGQVTLADLKSRGTTPKFITQSIAAAQKIDPHYNPADEVIAESVAKSQTANQFFGSANSLISKGGTLDQLEQQGKQIPNNKLPVLNTVEDWQKLATGKGPLAGYAATALGVADDYGKVMGGGTASDHARDAALRLFAAAQSPEQRANAIAATRNAVQSQRDSRIGNNQFMKRQYGAETSGTAKPSGPVRPAGATMKVPGSDGKLHWSDGKADLGVAE